MAEFLITPAGKKLLVFWNKDTEITIGQLAKKHSLTYTEVGKINRIIFKPKGDSSNESSIERYFRKGE